MLIGIISQVDCCYKLNRNVVGRRTKGKGKERWKGTAREIKQRRGDRFDSVSISSEALLRVCRESVTCGKSWRGGVWLSPGPLLVRCACSNIRVSLSLNNNPWLEDDDTKKRRTNFLENKIRILNNTKRKHKQSLQPGDRIRWERCDWRNYEEDNEFPGEKNTNY